MKRIFCDWCDKIIESAADTHASMTERIGPQIDGDKLVSEITFYSSKLELCLDCILDARVKMVEAILLRCKNDRS